MDDLTIRPGLTIPASDLDFSAARSGGPGGQHVNKTNSKVVLKLDLDACEALTGPTLARLRQRIPPRYLAKDASLVIVTCEEHRDQLRNREAALLKLASVLRAALARPKRRRPTKPTRASKERRLKAKQARGKRKQDRSKRWD